MSYFWRPLDSNSPDFTKKNSGTSRITHQTAHIAYEFDCFKYEIKDNDCGALKQFIETNPQIKFTAIFLMKITTLTTQIHRTIKKLVPPNISL